MKKGGFHNTIDRRDVLKYTGAFSATALAGCVSTGGDGESGEYPSSDIRYIIPFGQGGGTDVYARELVPILSDELGVEVAIENISGAASLRGTGEMMYSEPDGYTVAAFNPPSTPVSEMVNPQDYELPDAEGVATYARTPYVIVAHPDHEFEGYEDLIDRYTDGEFDDFGGKERGGIDHVSSLLMKQLHDFEWETYVGYDGTGPAVQATMQDEIPAAISTDEAAMAGVEDGRLDVVACLSSEGTAVFPDLESVTDPGYENIDYVGQLTRGIYAPPETPRDVRETFAEAVEAAVESDHMQEWAEETGNDVVYGGPDNADQVLNDAYEQIPNNVDLEEIRDAAN